MFAVVAGYSFTNNSPINGVIHIPILEAPYMFTQFSGVALCSASKSCCMVVISGLELR